MYAERIVILGNVILIITSQQAEQDAHLKFCGSSTFNFTPTLRSLRKKIRKETTVSNVYPTNFMDLCTKVAFKTKQSRKYLFGNQKDITEKKNRIISTNCKKNILTQAQEL